MTANPTRGQVETAAELIALSEKGTPLDQVLRGEFKRRKGLTRRDSAVIYAVTHAYYRWVQWLDSREPVARQAGEAFEMDQRFQETPGAFSDSELLERAAPAWLAGEMDYTAAFARSLQTKPLLWLRARPGEAPTLSEKLDGAKANEARWKDALLYYGEEDLFRNEFFHAGDFEIQDLNSQAIGWLCAPQPGGAWWDCCAGEGGKTLHLSDLMRNQGLIWASETAEWRLEILRRRAGRARVFNYRAVLWTDQTRPPTKTLFDGVLVDAPCTGTGTWQRNPQARWTTGPDTVERLAQLQGRLLRLASASVKPGGRLVYSVCTLLRKETTAIARAFEESCPEFKPEEQAHPWTGELSSRHWFLPEQTKGNGMFAAVWRREGAGKG